MSAIIIGAGPAGCSAAIHLARAGIMPTLYEQNAQTGDHICGGFLSWTTLARLRALGLYSNDLNGHVVRRLRIFAGNQSWDFPLPAECLGLSRHRLDSLLIKQVVSMGIEVHRGMRIHNMDEARTLFCERYPLARQNIFLATGKQDLRGITRPAKAAGADPALGLRVRLPPSSRNNAMMSDAIELHIFKGGYIGLILQEDGSVNCCLAIRKSRYALAHNKLDHLLDHLARQNRALATRLDASPPPVHFDAVGHIPYGWSTAETQSGIFRLGDQAAVIPSLVGEGIGLALASGMMAAQYATQGNASDAQDFQRDFAHKIRRPMSVANILKNVAESGAMANCKLAFLNRLSGLVLWLARQTRIPA